MDSFTPVRTVKITELIVDQIRKAILEGTMKPGDKLPSERELSDKFEASRIAVREALISLESAGLVQIKPGSGALWQHNIEDNESIPLFHPSYAEYLSG